ncbi:MAG: hypothetical protein J6J93_11595 [Muribaculaceae bacterium]|nr:hypothetical protein [Muribaculaceae bacterium]
MRKTFISRLSSFSLFSVLVAMVALAGSFKAAAATTDLGELEFGKTYTIPQYNEITATITAISDGVMTQVGSSDIHLYVDEAHTSAVEGEFAYLAGGPTTKYQVSAGTKYYVYSRFAMAANTVTFYMDGVAEQPLQAQFNVNPGSTLNFANYPNLMFYFNREVNLDKDATVIEYTNSKTSEKATVSATTTVNGKNVSVSVYSALKPLIQDGSVNPGDQIYVRLKDVKSATGSVYPGTDDRGYVSFAYICGSIPTVSTAETVPAVFKSFWKQGDADGILSKTFDSELSIGNNTRVELIYGDIESEAGAYAEVVPVTLSDDAKTLRADFTGKLRTPLTMTPLESGTVYETMGVKLVGVVDKFGNPVQSEGQGTIGAYSWSIPYQLIERSVITAEFTPANGSTLDGVEEISVYLSPLKTFSFTGFKISYADGDATKTVVVDKASAKVSDQSADGNSAEYTFAIPAEVKGKKNVTVTLDNLVSEDGFDHSLDVCSTYDAFVITYADPANGSEFASISDIGVLKIETNYSEKYPEMYIVYEIEDLNPTNPDQTILKYSWLNRQEDGSYEAEVHGYDKLFQGHEYSVTFTAWATEMDKNYKEDPIGSATIYWRGTTMPYVYSSVAFEGITPDPETVLSASDNVFTVKFDGLVRLDSETTFINTGMGSTYPFESITPLDPQDNDGVLFSNIWELKVSEDFMATLTAQLDISFKAIDAEGRCVKGNLGEDENTYFYYSYDTKANYEEYEVTAVGEEPLTSVSEFHVSAGNRGISFNWVEVGSAYVVKMRDIVAHVKDVVPDDYELGSRCPGMTLVLDETITEGGDYMLVIPASYFMIGEEFDARNSAEVMYEFTVIGGEQPGTCNVALTPAPGDVTSLPQRIEMLFTDYSSVGIGSGAPTLTIDGAEPIKLGDVELDNDLWNMCTVVLPQEYTDPGTYVISFPAGYFLLGDEGADAPELSFEYVIKEEISLNIKSDPEEGVVTSLPKQIELTFVDYFEAGIGSGKGQLTIDGGASVDLPDAEYGEGWNQILVNLPQEYTEAGVYVISFPAAYFVLDGNDAPAVKLTYEISSTGAISNVVVSADGLFHVYSLTGVKVLETADYNDVLGLSAGVYIVNGTKVLVK